MRAITATLRAPALALAGALALAASAAPARADLKGEAAANEIFEVRLDTGYRATDVDDNRAFLFPYDPLESGPVFGFDLLYLTPAAGTIAVEGGFIDADGWHASGEYSRGADLAVRAETMRFSHAREHRAAVAPANSPAPGYGAVEIEGHDADPGASYRDVRQDTRASVRLRAPSYPAHLRASGRVMVHKGEQQMRYFFRSCSTHVCHVNERTRPLDQETKEYQVGLDSHLGWVDLSYGHSALTYRDNADDPVDAIGDISGGLPAGNYAHDVNPDISSHADEVRLNTLLSNRVVLSAAYADATQDNDDGGVGRRTRTAGANLAWRATPTLSFVARYDWDRDETDHLSAAARALREQTNAAHASSGWTHQHVVEPEDTRQSADLRAGYDAGGRLSGGLRVGWRGREQRALIHKVAGEWNDDPAKSTTTFATLDARVHAAAGLEIDGSAGLERTSDPELAVDTTSLRRFGLGVTWTPVAPLTLRAAWQGYRGKNDDEAALQAAYEGLEEPVPGAERSVRGDAYTVMAAWVPCERFSLSASWGLTDAGIEQDLLIGAPTNPAYVIPSPDTDWSGRTQVADVRATWTATRRLAFTAEALWIDGLESYEPTAAQAAGLEELGTVDFQKLMATLTAEVRITREVGCTLGGFWARYRDEAGGEGDGTVRGLLATVDLSW